MEPTTTSRPYMPDYPRDPEGDRLLPWSWAVDRLERSTEYFAATVDGHGRPAITPVWGVLIDGELWFSCAPRSRKARNLADRPAMTLATNDGKEPVIVEGTAHRVPAEDHAAIERLTDAMEAKYHAGNTADFFRVNAVFRVTPHTVLGMVEDDFVGSPTRWSAFA